MEVKNSARPATIFVRSFNFTHGKHTTIITAQMPIAKWYEYIVEPTIADGQIIASRSQN
jgi:hypothetical protein